MRPKMTFVQRGTFLIIAFSLAILTLFIAFLIKDSISGIDRFIYLITMALMLLPLSFFYKLTIEIDDIALSFSLGIGLIRKRYPLTEIESCKSVRNSMLYGLGFRLIPNGWLYNVSGLKAIEIHFKGSKRIVRIGTNDPDKICREINRRIAPSPSGTTES